MSVTNVDDYSPDTSWLDSLDASPALDDQAEHEAPASTERGPVLDPLDLDGIGEHDDSQMRDITHLPMLDPSAVLDLHRRGHDADDIAGRFGDPSNSPAATVAAVRVIIAAEPEPEPEHASEGWEPLTPLTGTTSPPPFPTECLPPPFREYVELTSASMRTAPDLLAAAVLPVLATVVAGTWRVEVEPGGWAEPLTLHVVAVAPPGSMKSAAMTAACRPLADLETELHDRHAPEVAQAAAMRRIDEGRLKKLEADAAGGDTDAQREALELAARLATEAAPVVPRLFTTDATPEALERLLAAHGERFAWLDPEGGLFRIAAGGYGKGAGPNLEVFLKGHAGDVLRTERVGRESVALRAPALTIGVAVQPSVMVAAGKNPDLTGRGLLARQLIVWPDLDPVDRSQPPTPAPAGVADAYAAQVAAMFYAGADLEPGTARTITVHADALEVLREWFAWTAQAQRIGGALAAVPEWAAKLDGATVRLAAILALAAHPTAAVRAFANTPPPTASDLFAPDQPAAFGVDLAAAERAIGLARYFVAHALRAFGEVGLRDDVRHARTCLDAIRRARPTAEQWRDFPEYVTTRDVHRAVRGNADLSRADDVRAALACLADAGYLRLAPTDDHKGRGRPSERWTVNPAAVETDQS